MKWEVPYVVFRHKGDGKFDEVFQTHDFKKARYWMTYIAEIGDVLCRTTAHDRHSKQSEVPEYLKHKEQSGVLSNSQEAFVTTVVSGKNYEFPVETSKTPSDYS